MLTRVVRYGVALNYLKINFNRKRNILIHHGLMGSCKNFRSISKSKAFSDYFNSYMIDARNHGTSLPYPGDSPHTKTHTISELADDLY
jgi:pimeloyl-ACP methyl ester carboxylesterase